MRILIAAERLNLSLFEIGHWNGSPKIMRKMANQ